MLILPVKGLLAAGFALLQRFCRRTHLQGGVCNRAQHRNPMQEGGLDGGSPGVGLKKVCWLSQVLCNCSSWHSHNKLQVPSSTAPH